MQPSDPSVDPDADPTRVRPDRQVPVVVPADEVAPTDVVGPSADDVGPPVGAGSPTGAAGELRSAADVVGPSADVAGPVAGAWGSAVDPVDAGRVRSDADRDADLDADRDAEPTAVRPRSAGAVQEAERSDEMSTSGLWGEPARWDGRRDDGEAVPVAEPHSWAETWDRRAGRFADEYADGDGSRDDPDGAPTTVLTVAHDSDRKHRRRDWAWVEEWREERAAPAWGPGIALGIFVALIVAVALIVLTAGVSDSPVLAIVFNVIIAAGMAPALWLCRSLPVLRFLAGGAAAGIVFGWIAMLTTF